MGKEIEAKALTHKEAFDMKLRRIDSMAELEAEDGTLPYISGKRKSPYNAVTGREVFDMNSIDLELYAAMVEAKSATFIEGCNAQLIGLELDGYESPMEEDFAEYAKSGIMDGSTYESIKARGTLPALLMVNVRNGDGSTRIEYMYVYFVDQFTTKSLVRALQMLGRKEATDE